MNDLKQQVINEFGSDITQEMYKKKAFAGLWETEEQLIKKYFKPKSYILDVGCGTGRTTIPLFQMGYRVLGLDITPEMIFNARIISKNNNLNIDFSIGDATDLKYPENYFDNAFFSNNGWTQIPGKENRIKALKEIYRVIRPGGYFIFTTHIRKFKGFEIFWIKQWIKIRILKKFGFKIMEIDYGDRFFNRETSGTIFKQKNFIHIPKQSETEELINKSGFKLVENMHDNRQNILSMGDKNHQTPIFFVCKK